MHFSRRGIIVAFCFGLWIGTAGLICQALVARPPEGDETQFKLSNPGEVVHAESAGTAAPARVELAQR
ncbi:MAG: hypothetical protein ABSB74_18025 [Tepidisphaeraceae bacterium]